MNRARITSRVCTKRMPEFRPFSRGITDRSRESEDSVPSATDSDAPCPRARNTIPVRSENLPFSFPTDRISHPAQIKRDGHPENGCRPCIRSKKGHGCTERGCRARIEINSPRIEVNSLDESVPVPRARRGHRARPNSSRFLLVSSLRRCEASGSHWGVRAIQSPDQSAQDHGHQR